MDTIKEKNLNLLISLQNNFEKCLSFLLSKDQINPQKQQLEDLVTEYVRQATELKEKFSLLKQYNTSPNELIQQEIKKLKEESERKEELLQKYSSKVHDWQDTFNQLHKCFKEEDLNS